MFICRYLFHYSDLTIYFFKIKFVILVFYVFPIAMLFICFGFPDLLTLISTRVRIEIIMAIFFLLALLLGGACLEI